MSHPQRMGEKLYLETKEFSLLLSLSYEEAEKMRRNKGRREGGPSVIQMLCDSLYINSSTFTE